MSGAFRFGTKIVGLVSLAGILTGCGTTITGDTTLSDALSTLAQTVAADPNLSQLTVSDVVQGFAAYASQLAASSGAAGLGGMMLPSAPAVQLTADQQAQLEDLQGQLDRGEITQEQFAEQVHALIGDVAPGYAFAGMGMMGGPFRGDPVMELADQLQLTDEQRQQAEGIFAALHTDIETLRQSAQDQIKAQLTADQLARLEELQSQAPPAPPGGPGRRHMGPPPGNLGDDAQPPEPGLDIWTRLADELQLTDDQQTAVEQIRTDLRDAVEARHQQARDDFRAILTADQLTLLDQIEAEHEQP
jgi:Spy/CpxP family protein refolding chaperone